MQTAKQILAHLHSLENEANQAGMKRFAIGNDNTLGISLPVLREMSKSLKKQSDRHELAKTLWKSNIHEAMILASMLADSKQFTAEEMDSWTRQFYSWDLCDQVCTNLFHKTPYYLEKAFAYSYDQEEFVKRCGFVLMVQYTVHHKKESDEMCIQFLKRIEEEAGDERNFVKKALNWCLRQIGKRNAFLHPHALAATRRILAQGSRSARWIANDAIRELESEAVKKRLGLIP